MGKLSSCSYSVEVFFLQYCVLQFRLLDGVGYGHDESTKTHVALAGLARAGVLSDAASCCSKTLHGEQVSTGFPQLCIHTARGRGPHQGRCLLSSSSQYLPGLGIAKMRCLSKFQ